MWCGACAQGGVGPLVSMKCATLTRSSCDPPLALLFLEGLAKITPVLLHLRNKTKSGLPEICWSKTSSARVLLCTRHHTSEDDGLRARLSEQSYAPVLEHETMFDSIQRWSCVQRAPMTTTRNLINVSRVRGLSCDEIRSVRKFSNCLQWLRLLCR